MVSQNVNGRTRVVVAMSGGVDSSVAAALLVEQGYDVIGVTIKTHRYEDVGGNDSRENSCCSLDGINDARAIATTLGFPHYVLDFSDRFNADVISDFVREYLDGRTPNPCVICNRTIKWEELLRKATSLDAQYIATGHYARVRRDDHTRRYVISRGRDRTKDQSYALWGLTQDSLSRTLFPLAEYTKAEARAAAERLGLHLATKQESFEICFIPDNNYERFLKSRVPTLAGTVDGGPLAMAGKIIGHHRGYPFYTIGQRKGLGVSLGEPLYVTGIDPTTNTVQVGREEELRSTGLRARKVNLMKYPALTTPIRVDARIRYKDSGGPGAAEQLSDGSLIVRFDEPRRAVTPGQSVVLYEGDDLVGGGIIELSFS